jgi:hypothetical protein
VNEKVELKRYGKITLTKVILMSGSPSIVSAIQYSVIDPPESHSFGNLAEAEGSYLAAVKRKKALERTRDLNER